MAKVKVFRIIRQSDETGISGSGHVMTGIIFEDGSVVIRWLSETPSTTMYQSWEDFNALHVKPHPTNETLLEQQLIEWKDGNLRSAGLRNAEVSFTVDNWDLFDLLGKPSMEETDKGILFTGVANIELNGKLIEGPFNVELVADTQV